MLANQQGWSGIRLRQQLRQYWRIMSSQTDSCQACELNNSMYQLSLWVHWWWRSKIWQNRTCKRLSSVCQSWRNRYNPSPESCLQVWHRSNLRSFVYTYHNCHYFCQRAPTRKPSHSNYPSDSIVVIRCHPSCCCTNFQTLSQSGLHLPSTYQSK